MLWRRSYATAAEIGQTASTPRTTARATPAIRFGGRVHGQRCRRADNLQVRHPEPELKAGKPC